MTFFVIIRGPLGCGKSILAMKLAKIFSADYYAVDIILKENNLENNNEFGFISERSFIRVNEIIAELAQKSLDNGKPVIFDGNFYWKKQIDDLIARLDYSHYVFTLKAPLEICIERDKNRSQSRGEEAARLIFNKTNELNYGTLIDVTRPEEESLKEISSYLSKLSTLSD